MKRHRHQRPAERESRRARRERLMQGREEETMLFDASNSYHRHMLHYESSHQLSLPEIVAMGSVDAHTAATLWHLIDHRASYIISGPTDPQPGVGKTTTLNSLLPFYPSGTGLVYTVGMYEDFSFLNDVIPGDTTVLANEVSDHLPIYMWGRIARRFLQLPEQGYSVATSCHADTLADVMAMLTSDIRLSPQDIRGVQVIVNIGLRGRTRPARRRWLTTHFVTPNATDPSAPVETCAISRWDEAADTFIGEEPGLIERMAAWAGETPEVFREGVAKREVFLQTLADQQTDHADTIEALERFRAG